jgi:hypothetical protein
MPVIVTRPNGKTVELSTTLETSAEMAEYARRYRQDPEVRRREADRKRQSTTGMSPDMYHQLLIDQAGHCAICDQPMIGDGPGQGACADHAHGQPGVYRGLLCMSCNTGLYHVEKPGWL